MKLKRIICLLLAMIMLFDCVPMNIVAAADSGDQIAHPLPQDAEPPYYILVEGNRIRVYDNEDLKGIPVMLDTWALYVYDIAESDTEALMVRYCVDDIPFEGYIKNKTYQKVDGYYGYYTIIDEINIPSAEFVDEEAEAATEAAAEPVIEEVTEAVTEPVTEAVVEETTEAATEAATEAVIEETTEAVTEPVTEAVVEETTEAATEAATEPVIEETTEAATEAATEPVIEETTEAATEAATEPVIEETTEAATEAVTEPVVEETTEAATEEEAEAVTEEATEAETEEETEAVTEEATEAETEEETEAATEEATEAETEEETEAVTEEATEAETEEETEAVTEEATEAETEEETEAVTEEATEAETEEETEPVAEETTEPTIIIVEETEPAAEETVTEEATEIAEETEPVPEEGTTAPNSEEAEQEKLTVSIKPTRTNDSGEENPPAEPENFTVHGVISFTGDDGNIEGVKGLEPSGAKWKDVLRPLVFSEPITVTLYYTVEKEDGTVEQKFYSEEAQIASSTDPFYLALVRDGDGGATYDITNIPKGMKIDGKDVNFTSFEISIPSGVGSESSLKAYHQSTSTQPVEVPTSDKADDQNFVFEPDMIKIKTKAEVTPAEATLPESGFDVIVAFSNELNDERNEKDLLTSRREIKLTINTDAEGVVTVPSFLTRHSTQTPVEGYLHSNDLAERDKYWDTDDVHLDDVGDVHVIITKNIAQNKEYPFDVVWVDNNSKSHDNEDLTGKFTLQYQKMDENGEPVLENGEPVWVPISAGELTAEEKEYLGIASAPALEQNDAASYVFTGLPYKDVDGHTLTYRVVPTPGTEPTGYVASADYSADAEHPNPRIIYTETTTFTATVEWQDAADQSGRPKLPDEEGDFKPEKHYTLKRKAKDGTVEVIELTSDNFKKNDDGNWTVELGNLERYAPNNQEYDYFLEQKESLPGYTTFYNNGSGPHAADRSACHNGGSIINRLYATTTFKTSKTWQDSDRPYKNGNSGDRVDRPEGTLTLWRFPVDANAEKSKDIDANFDRASQVIFMDANGDEMLATAVVPSDGGEAVFKDDKGNPLQLPLYDEAGREYVYFVRETIAPEHYATSYSGAEHGSTTNPIAADGSTTINPVTNTYREKAAVNVTVQWKNPSALDDLENKSVQLKLMVPKKDANGDDLPGEYEEVTVYSPIPNTYDEETKVQTLDGFDPNITTLDLTFYVNIYDRQGRPYAMKDAVIKEVNIVDNTDKDNPTFIQVTDNAFTIGNNEGNNEYKVDSAFDEDGPSTSSDGLKQFNYTVTNTITGNTKYQVVKVWNDSITGSTATAEDKAEYAKVTAVQYRLYCTSTAPNSSRQTVRWTEGENDAYVWHLGGSTGETVLTIPRGENENTTWNTILAGLPKYDADGYQLLYSAQEIGLLPAGVGRPDWGHVHSYNDTPKADISGKTTITNGKYNSYGYLYANKTWMDNGDTENRKPVINRVILKADIQNWLDEHPGTTAPVNLDIFDKYYQLGAMTSGNSWYAETKALNEVADQIKGTHNETEYARDYAFLEYSVEDQKVTYLPSELAKAAEKVETDEGQVFCSNYTVTGEVQTSARRYRVVIEQTVNATSVARHTLTNTRIGDVILNVKKTWNDNNNIDNKRPASVQFKLYRDGQVLTGVTGIPGLNADGTITLTASNAVLGDSNQWTLTLENLPLFNEFGVPYTYDLVEVMSNGMSSGSDENGEDAPTSGYLSQKETTRVETDKQRIDRMGSSETAVPDRLFYSYGYKNTIVGQIEHVAYKIWKDGTSNDQRPDLVMTLQRKLVGEPDTAYVSIDPKNLGQDLLWEEGKPADTEKGTAADPWNWKITANLLPAYDGQGNKYEYRFIESMNHDGHTIYGDYVPDSRTVDDTDSDGNVIGTHEVFTNTLKNTMVLDNRKVWQIPAKYLTGNADLPSVQVELYRTVESITDKDILNGKTDAQITDGKQDGTFPSDLTKVDITTVVDDKPNDKSKFFFPSGTALDGMTLDEMVTQGLLVQEENGKYSLPMYDENGNTYTYLMREVIVDDTGNVVSQLYTETTINGGLENKFRPEVNRRTITVEKDWDRSAWNRENMSHVYPSVTYQLYRYIQGTGTPTATLMQEVKIPAEYFQKAENGITDLDPINGVTFEVKGNNVFCTFDDLLVYSPKGEQYGYYVVEKPIDGYTITYTDEQLPKDGFTPNSIPDEVTLRVGDNTVSVGAADRSDVTSLPANWAIENAKPNSEVKTTNKYETDTLNLRGKKTWNDYNMSDVFLNGARPDVTLSLYRYTGKEDGQQNAISNSDSQRENVPLDERDCTDENCKSFGVHIKWTKTENEDASGNVVNVWTYEIHNLPRFAPNGQRYIYVLSENEMANYAKPSAQTVVNPLAADTNKNYNYNEENGDRILNNINFTNSYSGSYTVRKDWIDGDNIYGLRPDSVTFVLERRKLNAGVDGDGNPVASDWERIPYVAGTGKNSKNENVTWNEVDGKIGITLTNKFAIANTKDSSWRFVFTNLPEYWDTTNADKNQWKKWEYRAEEIMIGSAKMELKTQDDGTVINKAGAFIMTYTLQNDKQTTAQNRIDPTFLEVTKTWKDDQLDMYYSRPDSVTFRLQMQGIKKGENDTEQVVRVWKDVPNPTDPTKPYTFELKPDPKNPNSDTWTATLKDLPSVVYLKTEDGLSTGYDDGYYVTRYRAVEIHMPSDANGVITPPSPDNAPGNIDGAQNYNDITSYDIDVTDPTQVEGYDPEHGMFVSLLTNKLITDTDIKVSKTWYTQEEAPKATFELLYRVAAYEDKDHVNHDAGAWKCFGGCIVEGSAELPEHTHDTAETDKKTGCIQHTLTGQKDANHPDRKYAEHTWEKVPKYNLAGQTLEYKVIEFTPDGYELTVAEPVKDETSTPKVITHSFTNVQLQDYTVTKNWINDNYADYAEKDNGKFTATFRLEQGIANAEGVVVWSGVPKIDEDGQLVKDENDQIVPLTVKLTATDELSHTWNNLPKYDAETGDQIQYRAVEIEINGKPVENDTNGAYIVTYTYGTDTEATDDNVSALDFAQTETIATNRMVYGFVNLTKTGAYLDGGKAETATYVDSEAGEDKTKLLSGVKFDIQKFDEEQGKFVDYVKNVTTNEAGNLVNTNGKYGTEQKYLVSGTYKLVEQKTNAKYSLWDSGIEFTVGVNGPGHETDPDTGEHGTAWISAQAGTNAADKPVLASGVNYMAASDGTHAVADNCKAQTDSAPAYNIESRGIATFTKTGEKKSDGTNTSLDTHSGTESESDAYFAVYAAINGTETQVAGMMAASDGKTMVLTTLGTDGKTDNEDGFTALTNGQGIPYLRKETNGQLTLLSGTYTVKEITPPPGYKLDETARTLVISEIDKTTLNTADLSGVYAANKGEFNKPGETPSTDYEWNNNPNELKIYKLDQYGRHVDLKADGYLVLGVEGKDNSFLTGENAIRLYQSAGTATAGETAKIAATMSDGAAFETDKVPNITYTVENGKGYWTITGLFDVDKTYTLSEPNDSVPDENIVAKPIHFKVTKAGAIEVLDNTAELKDTPTSAVGNDFNNYYKSDANGNVEVLRDVARYKKSITLTKVENGTSETISNIAFGLYKNNACTESLLVGKVNDVDKQIYLVTDGSGKIDFVSSTQFLYKDGTKLKPYSGNVYNVLTGCELQYGLEMGDYYLKEVEYGSSDRYNLLPAITLTVGRAETGTQDDWESYATLSVSGADGAATIPEPTTNPMAVTVSNTLVGPKTLNLTKVDSENVETKLAGARFKLTYVSITDNDPGSLTNTASTDPEKAKPVVTYCVTDPEGVLRVCEGNDPDGAATANAPSIANKGTYTLVETKAPDATDGNDANYMTRTDGNGDPVTMLKFTVDSENKIVDMTKYNGQGELVTASESDDRVSLTATVKNEKTKVYIDKLNDIFGSKKNSNQTTLNGEQLPGATLEIYLAGQDGNSTGNALETWETSLTNGKTTYTVTPGLLKEDTEYILRETTRPNGYLTATDIHFKISGTTTRGSEVVSQLYVKTGDQWNVLGQTVPNVKGNTLTMVDEAIIAPVDLIKTVGETEPLAGARFEVKSLDDGGKLLGTAKTVTGGHLVWESIEETNTYSATALGMIFNEAGKRITSAQKDIDSVVNKTIILRENQSGYTFKEIYAPDNAYNNHDTYTVKITPTNYTAYRTDSGYEVGKYVNIVQASENNAEGTNQYTADLGTDGTKLVNPPFEATFKLNKFDAEHPTNSTDYQISVNGLSGVKFKLEKLENALGTADKKTIGSDFTTDANGVLSITLTEKGTYLLTELQPKEGYNNNPIQMEFTIENDDYGKTWTYDATETNTKHITEIQSGTDELFELPNTRKHGTVTLTKKDPESGKLLNDVEYTLERIDTASDVANHDWLYQQNSVTKDFKTGKEYTLSDQGNDVSQLAATISADDGVLTISNLQWGTYHLTEKTEQPGYILRGEFTFTVDAQHLTHELQEENSIVPNNKNRLKIVKVDTEDVESVLANAQFELYPVKNESNQLIRGTAVQNFYPTANATEANANTITAGIGYVYGLTAGSYILHETKAPDGYELAKDVFFTMNRNGTIQDVASCVVAEGTNIVQKDTDAGVIGLTVASDSGSTGAPLPNPSMTVKDKPIEVELTKKLLVGSDEYVVEPGLGEAKYEIVANDGSTFAKSTTKTMLTVTGNTIKDALKAELIGGKYYTITEIHAPAGYELRQPVSIHVNEDGTITPAADNGYLTGGDNDPNGVALLTFTDIPIELNLGKVDKDGTPIKEKDDENPTLSLGYAKFTIKGKFVNEAGTAIEDGTDGQGVEITDLTTANFRTKLYKRVIGGETYTVKETEAPKGYILTPEFTITVDKYGTISTVTVDNGMASADNATKPEILIVKDAPTVANFRKVEDNNQPLAGAQFTLTLADGETANPAFVNVATTNVTGAKDDSTLTANATQITWTSTTDPAVITNMLIAEVVYNLHEERVPNHEVMAKDIQFHLTKEGKVVIEANGNSTIPNNTGMEAAAVGNDHITMTIQNPIIKGSVTLTKFWRETNDDTDNRSKPSTYMSQPLKDAKYVLYRVKDAEGKPLSSEEQVKTSPKSGTTYAWSPTGINAEFFTAADGTIQITGLPEGWYEFEEIDAPYAYHINEHERIPFQIHNDAQAREAYWTKADGNEDTSDTKGTAVDTRINAKITMTKWDGTNRLQNAVFDVLYSETGADGSYSKIGEMTTGENGSVQLTQATYDSTKGPEGLWRGYYILTETKAPGQMLNNLDGDRNTIKFQIGNEIQHDYKLNSTLQTYLQSKNLGDVVASGFIRLTTAEEEAKLTSSQPGGMDGVVDTPIPTKTVTVEKKWEGDATLINTFRPVNIQVELYRTYDGAAEPEKVTKDANGTAIMNPVTLSKDENLTDPWTTETWENLPAYFNDDTNSNEHVTRLYTYYVKEVDANESKNLYWYSDSCEDPQTYTYEQNTGVHDNFSGTNGAKDGNMKANVTNTMTTKPLTISKTLGGGSDNDEFQVRVKLTKDNQPVGNNGYYLDGYKVKAKGATEWTSKSDTDQTHGWMTIKGGETITIDLPVGVHYEVEEKLVKPTTDAYGRDIAESSGTLNYIPRYLDGYTGTIPKDKDNTTAPIRNAVVKHLSLTKIGEDGAEDYLNGAEFKIVFTPGSNIADLQGYAAETDGTYSQTCKTNASGLLVREDGKPIDLTAQGTYTIYETQAPDGYITPTGENGQPRALVQILVNGTDEMSIVSNTKDYLVTDAHVSSTGEEAVVTVRNEKTKVYIDKLNDIGTDDLTKTRNQQTNLTGEQLSGAHLEIYEVSTSGTPIAMWTTDGSTHTLDTASLLEAVKTTGTVLKENTDYYLVEADTVPDGYLKADPIKFQIFGSIVFENSDGNKEAVSRLLIGENKSREINIQKATETLTMVDEAVIAPVDLTKVRPGTSGNEPLTNAEFTVTQGGTKLGIAKTNSDGNLVWKSIDSYGLIFNESGKRITNATDDIATVIDKPVILRKINGGYNFKETYAPDNAFNQEETFHVVITDKNYRDYKSDTSTTGYNDTMFVDILAANDNSVGGYTAELVSSTTKQYSNPAFTATFKLNKFDAEYPGYNGAFESAKNGLKDVEFTLTRTHDGLGNELNPKETITSDELVTVADGLLSITLDKKGTYELKESKPLRGYELNTEVMTFTIVNSDQDKTLTYDADVANTNHTKMLVDKDGAPATDGAGKELTPDTLPNKRYHGTITLTKKDLYANPEMLLNDVQYTLTRIDPSSEENPNKAVDGVNPLLYGADEGKSVVVKTGFKYALAGDGNSVVLANADGTAGNKGVLEISNLQWGTYKLVESRELPGYLRTDTDDDNAIIFTIGPDTVADEDNSAKVHKLAEQFNERNQVTFVKKSQDGTKFLPGAVFEVHVGDTCSASCEKASFYETASATSTVLEVTTKETGDEKGKVTIYGLDSYVMDSNGNITSETKTYHLVETTAPKGYKLADPVTFTIDRDGTVTVDDVNTNKTVTMSDEPIQVNILKVGELAATTLPHAHFTLTDICTSGCDNKLANGNGASGDAAKTDIETDSSGKFTIDALCIAGHTYQLEETKAPDGYECTAVVQFTVDKNGYVTITDSDGGYEDAKLIDNEGNEVTAPAVSSTVQISNEKIRLKLTKQDLDDETKKLSGVTFTVEDACDSCTNEGKFADSSTAPITLTTDESGLAGGELDGLLIHGHTYKLVETSIGTNTTYRFAPDSAIAMRTVTFTVQKNGTLIDANGNASIKSQNTTGMFSVDGDDPTNLIVKNEKIKLEISKVDQAALTGLAGVTLKLTGTKTSDSSAVEMTTVGLAADGTWTTDGNAKLLKGLEPGTYKLEEVSPPVDSEGKTLYNPIFGKLTFTIMENGQVKDVSAITDSETVTVPLDGNGFTKNYKVTNPEDGVLTNGSKSGAISLTVTNAKYSTLQILKLGDDTNAPLKDVEFRLDYADASNASVTATTGADGVATFENLPDGTYTITETKTADGYNLLSTSLTVTIDRNGEEYEVVDSTITLTRKDGTDTLEMTVYNRKGFALPTTGATTPQLPVSILFAVGLAEWLVLYRYAHSDKRRKRGVRKQ